MQSQTEMSKTSAWVSVAWPAAIAIGLALLHPAGAEAHARYLRSVPGEGATVSQAPARVDIWFAQDLFRRQGENRIEVTGPDGRAVQVGDPVVDDDDRTHLWVELEAGLLPGEYRVVWRSLSAEDGDSDEGEFGFLFDPAAGVTSTPMGVASATAPPQSTATSAPQSLPTPTATPVPASNGRCALALVPAVELAAFRWPRRRRICAGS